MVKFQILKFIKFAGIGAGLLTITSEKLRRGSQFSALDIPLRASIIYRP
jgi:hypothetical protein